MIKQFSAQIGLVNPKSPTNVGSVLRAAGCYGAQKVLYTGERFDRAIKFQTDTKDRIQTTPLEKVDGFIDKLSLNTEIVCVDLIEGAIALPQFDHPANALYIFGPEDSSLSQELVDKAHHRVYVPTIGCMNLAASVNVVLYDRQVKLGLAMSRDEQNNHIRENRDQNNRLRAPS